jgi:hypothetical protein
MKKLLIPLIASLAFLSWTGTSFAAISFVRSTSTQTAGTADGGRALTFTSATAGNLILVFTAEFGITSSTLPTDNRNSTYKTAIDDASNNTGLCLSGASFCRMSLFYTENLSTTGSLTINTTGSINNHFMAIFEYSGAATSNSLDATSTGTGVSVQTNSNNITTTGSADLLFGMMTNGCSLANCQVSSTNGFVNREVQLNGATTFAVFGTQEKIATSTVTASSSFIIDNVDWVAAIASFKAAASTPASAKRRKTVMVTEQ